eukprot:3768452-Rhodomonas_salina.2
MFCVAAITMSADAETRSVKRDSALTQTARRRSHTRQRRCLRACLLMQCSRTPPSSSSSSLILRSSPALSRMHGRAPAPCRPSSEGPATIAISYAAVRQRLGPDRGPSCAKSADTSS